MTMNTDVIIRFDVELAGCLAVDTMSPPVPVQLFKHDMCEKFVSGV